MKELHSLVNSKWNRIGLSLEPIGVTVRVLTKDLEIYLAKRSSIASSYDNPVYISIKTNKEIENVIGWSYG